MFRRQNKYRSVVPAFSEKAEVQKLREKGPEYSSKILD